MRLVTSALLPDWLNPTTIITNLGGFAVLGTLAIVFAECGLLLGFFLPGDSLLFTVGLFIASGAISWPLPAAALLIAIAAFAGNVCGYWIGRTAGPAVFSKADSKLFKREYVERTEAFFAKHGPRAVLLARFVPVVRTFATVMAGVGKMDTKVYYLWSAMGALLWGAGVTVLGYYLGQIDFVKKNVEIIFLIIVAMSFIPIILEAVRARRTKPAV